jgi:hypothetical protein
MHLKNPTFKEYLNGLKSFSASLLCVVHALIVRMIEGSERILVMPKGLNRHI